MEIFGIKIIYVVAGLIAIIVGHYLGSAAFQFLESDISEDEDGNKIIRPGLIPMPKNKIIRFLILEFLSFGGWALIPLFIFLGYLIGVIFLAICTMIEKSFIRNYKLINYDPQVCPKE